MQDTGPLVSQRLHAAGTLNVMRITKALRTSGEVLEFAGVPARQGSKARLVRVHFTNHGTSLPPMMDEATGCIDLYYPHRDHPEVQELLNAKRARFCYFWRSAHGKYTHAWLLSSPQ